MRKIKFRGKSDDDWAYGYLLKVDEINQAEHEHFNYFIQSDYIQFEEYINYYITDDNTIGQFTGLYDKNGKEIYEGDIVSNGIEKCIIVWVERYAGFMLKLIGNDTEAEWTNPIIDITADDEVIGNIWDDSDLLNDSLVLY